MRSSAGRDRWFKGRAEHGRGTNGYKTGKKGEPGAAPSGMLDDKIEDTDGLV